MRTSCPKCCTSYESVRGFFPNLQGSVCPTCLDGILLDTSENPIFFKTVLGITLFVWKKFILEKGIITTEPYTWDGDYPIIYFRLGWLELMFENKRLYKFLYKREYGFCPRGLE